MISIKQLSIMLEDFLGEDITIKINKIVSGELQGHNILTVTKKISRNSIPVMIDLGENVDEKVILEAAQNIKQAFNKYEEYLHGI